MPHNFPPNMIPPPNLVSSKDGTAQTDANTKDYFENQYYYYRSLNEAMDYQIKAFEFNERLRGQNKAN